MEWVGPNRRTFEIQGAAVCEHAQDGTRRQQHIYDLDQIDEAWARFATLRLDPLRIPPNAATRAR